MGFVVGLKILIRLENFFKILVFICIFIGSFVQAHPVIYEDGFVYWGEFSNQKNTQILSYTFHPHFAFQLSSDFRKKSNFRDYQLGVNTLVWRGLLKDSQANIYTSISGGFFINKWDGIFENDRKIKSLKLSERLIFQWSLSADWESRRLYTAGNIMLRGYSKTAEDLSGDFNYRIGFAPYVAGMDTLQTWFVLMFQVSAFGTINKGVRDALLRESTEGEITDFSTIRVMDQSALELNWKITPLLRFFYKNVLWEIGSSLQSDFYLTLMVHY